MHKVKFSTLGCRLNQYETQAIREQFARAGYEETSESREADVFVLNTCTVTGEADRESRYRIRKFHRENPDARIVVTGCYVERDREKVESIEGVSLTVLNREKSELFDLLESCTSLNLPRAEPPSKKRFAPLTVTQFEGRTRAHVKVQDGCNHACSFCKVVFARGPSRSRAVSEVVRESEQLAENGFREIVLTGIQLGAYGLDLERRQMLVDLLHRLSEIPRLERIRLSSIEPTDVTDELIEGIAECDKACLHLHIPLQSGDDGVLKRMNRRYRATFYLDLIQRLRKRLKDFVLTTDVMVGFPGETEEEFQSTVQVLEAVEPYKLHIFPFSVREGTQAARLTDRVPRAEVRRRQDVLFQLEKKLRARVQRQFLGRNISILIEETNVDEGWVAGRSEHYLKVRFPAQAQPGEMLQVRMDRIDQDQLVGMTV